MGKFGNVFIVNFDPAFWASQCGSVYRQCCALAAAVAAAAARLCVCTVDAFKGEDGRGVQWTNTND